MGKKVDWATVQQYYDEGNSWRAVTKEFGVYNLSIQRAINRGDLRPSRTKSEAKRKAVAVCQQCSKDIAFYACQSGGKFCSKVCQAEHKWETETLPRIRAGEASDRTLRKYLLGLNDRCSRCNNNEWMGEPLNLQLDHIDGDCSNNVVSNARLLCPNCHSLTPTFGAKNRGKGKRRRS